VVAFRTAVVVDVVFGAVRTAIDLIRYVADGVALDGNQPER
jgi:hypothetical protein